MLTRKAFKMDEKRKKKEPYFDLDLTSSIRI